MLKYIQLKNFRSHEYSKIKLSRYITVLVGRSLAGKSNIARALRWVVFNRPAGNKVSSNFVDGPPTEVTVATERYRVVHVRLDGKNKYIIGPHQFSRVGRQVPDDVSTALNLDEINIQNQLDQHYLITSSPGQVTKEINKVIGADKADRWIKELTSKINNHNRTNRTAKDDVKRIREELKKYKVIVALEDISKTIDDRERKIMGLQLSNDAIAGSITQLKTINKKLDKLQDVPKVQQLLRKAAITKSKIRDLLAENHQLSRYRKTSEQLREKEEAYEQSKDLFIYKMRELQRCPLCTSLIDNETLNNIYREL